MYGYQGASTFIMSMSCWKSIGSPMLTPSLIVLKTFDGHTFQPYGILTVFPINIGHETIMVDVRVVYTPLVYNLLLRNAWFYVMKESFPLYLESLSSLIRETLLLDLDLGG
jgi:hypothetical protein